VASSVFLKGIGRDSEPARRELFPKVCRNRLRGQAAESESCLIIEASQLKILEWDSPTCKRLHVHGSIAEHYAIAYSVWHDGSLVLAII
jgi:hypothetical protein